MAPTANPVSSVPAVADHISLLKDIQNETKAAMSVAAETMKRYYDRFVQDAPDIEVGDRVWLDAQNVTTTAPTKKLADRRLGPSHMSQSHVTDQVSHRTVMCHPSGLISARLC